MFAFMIMVSVNYQMNRDTQTWSMAITNVIDVDEKINSTLLFEPQFFIYFINSLIFVVCDVDSLIKLSLITRNRYENK